MLHKYITIKTHKNITFAPFLPPFLRFSNTTDIF
nr:MAG TPA: hypothetical protein [Caudoviricetes sp.]